MHPARLLALLPLAAPALAQTPSLPPQGPQAAIVRGQCQPSGCDEFALVGVETVRSTIEGSLKQTRLRTYRSSWEGRQAQEVETGYVYCSPTRPAVIAEQDGAFVAFFLAPFAVGESRETARKNTNFVATYFASCHGPDVAREAVRDLRRTASRLGYLVEATTSEVKSMKRPEDVISADALPVARTAPRRETVERQRNAPGFESGYADAPGYRYPGSGIEDGFVLVPPGHLIEE